jgi:hypothetical protein
MRVGILLIGIVLVMVGLLGGLALSFIVFQAYDPVKDPAARIEGSGPVELKKGDYEIWIDESDSTGHIRITDPNGEEVDLENPPIAPSQKGYMADLEFTADETGTYYFERNENTTLYVMESQINSVYTMQFGPCCGGAVLSVLGAIVAIVGLVLKRR